MDDITEKPLGLSRYTILAYPIGLIGLGFILKQLHWGWPGVVLYIAIGVGATVALIRSIQAKAAASGCASPAMLRYNRRMMWASITYMIAFLAATYAYKHGVGSGPGLWLVACGPVLGVLGMIWAMTRLVIEETDEYLRFRIVRQALFGTAGLLAVSTAWGFFEQFRLVPHVPAWGTLPIFALFLGVSNIMRWNRT